MSKLQDHEQRKICVCPSGGFYTEIRVRPHSAQVQRRLPCARAELLQPVSPSDVRPADCMRLHPRHLPVPEGSPKDTVSAGVPPDGERVVAVEGQPRPRQPHLGRVRPCSDKTCPSAVRRRAGTRSRASGMGDLRRRLDHRVLQHQSDDLGIRQVRPWSGQDAHGSRPEGWHTGLHPHNTRQVARQQPAWCDGDNPVGDLRDGQGLRGLRRPARHKHA